MFLIVKIEKMLQQFDVSVFSVLGKYFHIRTHFLLERITHCDRVMVSKAEHPQTLELPHT